MNNVCINTFMYKKGIIYPIKVSAYIRKGLNTFRITGNANSTIKEVESRLKTSFKELGYKWPYGRIVVDLSPHELSKSGGGFDLPIAMAILLASNQIDYLYNNSTALGSINLSGKIESFKGFFQIIEKVYEENIFPCFIPRIDDLLVNSFSDFGSFLKNFIFIDNISYFFNKYSLKIKNIPCLPPLATKDIDDKYLMKQVNNIVTNLPLECFKNQGTAMRALSIAIAGNHPLLMIGSYGTGKTSIAQISPYLLPSKNIREEFLNTLYKLENNNLVDTLELSKKYINYLEVLPNQYNAKILTHENYFQNIYTSRYGILFVDELSQYSNHFLDALQIVLDQQSPFKKYEPLKHTTIIACSNPCNCGNLLEPNQKCICSRGKIEQFQGKFKGSLIDRFHLKLNLIKPLKEEWSAKYIEDDEEQKEYFFNLIKQITKARNLQKARNKDGNDYLLNGEMEVKDIINLLKPDPEIIEYIEKICKKNNLNMRSLKQILTISQTIADLDGSNYISEEHILEAFFYNNLTNVFQKKYSVLGS